MRIRNERPPMFAEIDAAFSVAGKPVLFCWGDTVYNPEDAAMSYELGAHEAVHSERQGDTDETIRAWCTGASMKIADDFDAIRQRAREIAEERQPSPVWVMPALTAGGTTYADAEADVSDHYFPIGMIVA